MENEMENESDETLFNDKRWWKVVWFAKDEFTVERLVYAEEEENALIKAFYSFADTELRGGFWMTIFMLDVESELSSLLMSHFPEDPSLGNPEWKTVSKRARRLLGTYDIVDVMQKLKKKYTITIRELNDYQVLT